jgi:hypothetical protein
MAQTNICGAQCRVRRGACARWALRSVRAAARAGVRLADNVRTWRAGIWRRCGARWVLSTECQAFSRACESMSVRCDWLYENGTTRTWAQVLVACDPARPSSFLFELFVYSRFSLIHQTSDGLLSLHLDPCVRGATITSEPRRHGNAKAVHPTARGARSSSPCTALLSSSAKNFYGVRRTLVQRF